MAARQTRAANRGMSGGEKSLAALAMIFAIQRLSRRRFIVHEIDMFLDGANAERVARMIKKLLLERSVIVVSLRKPMIEAASRTIRRLLCRRATSRCVTRLKLLTTMDALGATVNGDAPEDFE